MTAVSYTDKLQLGVFMTTFQVLAACRAQHVAAQALANFAVLSAASSFCGAHKSSDMRVALHKVTLWLCTVCHWLPG